MRNLSAQQQESKKDKLHENKLGVTDRFNPDMWKQLIFFLLLKNTLKCSI